MFNPHYLAGLAYLEKGENPEAKMEFLQSVIEHPEVAQSWFYLGKACFLADDPVNGITFLAKYITLASDVADLALAYDLTGQCYQASDNEAEALANYETAISLRPECESALHNMGILYMSRAQEVMDENASLCFESFDLARTFLFRALEFCATNPKFLHSVASWYEAYVDALENVIVASKEVLYDHYEVAISYYRKAVDACDDSSSLFKNIANAHLTECLAQSGHCFYRNEDYGKAMDFYMNVIERDSKHLVVLNQIGMCYFKQQSYEIARRYFSRIIDETDDTQEQADAWLNMACAWRHEKNWHQARETLLRAKELAPEDSAIEKEDEALRSACSEQSLLTAPQALFHHDVKTASSNMAPDDQFTGFSHRFSTI